MKFFLAFVALFALLALVAAQDCPLDFEEFSSCGTACPETCDSLASGTANDCGDDCVAGCFCFDGFVRNGMGRCVPVSRC